MKGRLTITVTEARKILGKDADTMTDTEIEEIIDTLTLMARDTVEKIKHKILLKRDAKMLAELVYDIYTDKKANDDKTTDKS